jgi:hypothetical protein
MLVPAAHDFLQRVLRRPPLRRQVIQLDLPPINLEGKGKP